MSVPLKQQTEVSVTADSSFDKIVERLGELVEAGQMDDVLRLINEHPEQAPRLRQLLPAIEALASFDELPNAFPSTADAAMKGVLGSFRIVREIGRGGMGVVYEAEQISLGRRVALKVLPLASLLDVRRLERFRHEAQAAAMLRHPHIVTVYSVGCERGVNYYAMDYIEGLSLAEVVEQLRAGDCPNFAESTEQNGTVPFSHSADTTPLAALSTLRTTQPIEFFRAIARLGIQAAEALDCAHQMGVVHRDIKPSNLLLDTAGKLWITDFGLAMTQSDAGLTMTGDLLGTLRYMSPEQAAGKRLPLDHRTDVYSLGITLYELLAGRPAFDTADRAELLRAIAEVDPQPLHKVIASIPADLETIVLKAMEKDATDRYATAQDLAHDLSQFANDRPIKASRPNMRQRLTRWSRRNQGVVAVAAGTMLFLLVASSIATAIVWQEKGRTQVALEEMSKQKTVATQQQAVAEKSAAESKALVRFLVDDLLSAVDPQIAPGHEVTVAEVLAQAEQKIDAEMREQPLLEASIRHAMAKAYRALAKEDEAERHLRRAMAIRSRELGNDRLTLKTQLDLALCLFGKGRVDDAYKLVQENLAACIKVLGSDDQDTMEARSGLAMVQTRRGQYEEAGELWRMDLDWSRRTLGPEHPGTLIAMYNLAFLSEAQERYEDARRVYQEILQIERRTLGPDHLDALTTEGQLAGVLRELGQHDEARKRQEHILEVTRRVYGPEHIATAAAMNALATTMGEQGNYNEEARRMGEKAVEIAYRGRYWNELNEFAWNCAGRARLPDGRAKLFYLRSIANSHLQSDEGRRWAPGLYAAALEIMGDSPESDELRQLREEAASLLNISEEELRRHREGAAKELFKKDEQTTEPQ